jgi:60 kDa SS-A/Ro ribonucleoprotein
MTSTGFSIADPKDTGSLDIVGFDSSAVSVMGDFVRS